MHKSQYAPKDDSSTTPASNTVHSTGKRAPLPKAAPLPSHDCYVSKGHPRIQETSLFLKDKYHLHPTNWLNEFPGNPPSADVALGRINSFQLLPVKVCGAIADGCSVDALRAHLQSYSNGDDKDFKTMMRIITPVLYYAIGRNWAQGVSTLIEYGMDPNWDHPGFIPPLAFAITSGVVSAPLLQDTTEVVNTLLAAGADPRAIPEDLWMNYLEKPTEQLALSKTEVDPSRPWCDAIARKYLAQGLNLSQRYYLYRASQNPPRTERLMQLAEMHRILDLLKMPYRVVGQSLALRQIEELLVDQVAANVDDPSPIVMVFAGPPGHGKTELAMQLGNMLSVGYVSIPCSQVQDDTELFGSQNGYDRSEEGSRLNNFLSEHSGKCSVVFLDEFDKTHRRVCNSLLTVISEGEYMDRCNNGPVDCRKVIWILASNLGDYEIEQFYNKNFKNKKDEDKHTIDQTSLVQELKQRFKGRFGDPLISRIDLIVPFYPFTINEQAVVAHKFLLSVATNLRKDVDISPSVKRHMGHIILLAQNDGKLCKFMAERSYSVQSGARGLKREARLIRREVRKAYNALPGLVRNNDNQGPWERFEVGLMQKGDDGQEIVVRRSETS